MWKGPLQPGQGRSHFAMEPWDCLWVVSRHCTRMSGRLGVSVGGELEGCYVGWGLFSPARPPATHRHFQAHFSCDSHHQPTSLLSLERPTSSTDGLSYGTPQRNPKGPTSTKRVLAYTCICTHSRYSSPYTSRCTCTRDRKQQGKPAR